MVHGVGIRMMEKKMETTILVIILPNNVVGSNLAPVSIMGLYVCDTLKVIYTVGPLAQA